MVNISSDQRVGQPVAFSSVRHSGVLRRATLSLNFMKKTSRRDHPSEPSRRSRRDCLRNGESEGRWEFSLASEILFAFGSTERARRAAYRTAGGELRFLPL